MTEEYITQVSEEIEGKVTKKLSQDFSLTESRILGALSKLDEFLQNPQVRTCSGTVPGTSRNNDSENRKPTGDRSLSLNDSYPEVHFSLLRPGGDFSQHAMRAISNRKADEHISEFEIVCTTSGFPLHSTYPRQCQKWSYKPLALKFV